MGLIPLNAGSTVVDTKAAFEAGEGFRGRCIYIQNLDSEQLTAPFESNASYDLRIGPEFRLLHQSEKRSLSNDGKIILKGNESVLIQTEEHISLPKTVCGVIVSKLKVVQIGASNDASKVDPGYSGNLIVTLTNFSSSPIVLTRRQKFCSILFFRMEDDAKLYEKEQKRINDTDTKTLLDKIMSVTESRIILITHMFLTTVLLFAVIFLIVRG